MKRKQTIEQEREHVSRDFGKKWNRVLPLDEMLLDRWKKAKQLGFGEGSSIYEHALIYGKPIVGKNVWIGPFALIDATGGLEIGDGCDISAGAKILTHSTHLRCVSGRKQGIVTKPVKIGKCTFIGTNAVVLPGVTIGDYCIIGAGAVVTKSLPPHSVAVGVPAHRIKATAGERGNLCH